MIGIRADWENSLLKIGIQYKTTEAFNRFEVIVTGKNDFSSKTKQSNFVFQGLDFSVINVYRGNISKR